MWYALCAIAGLAVGCVVAWLVARDRARAEFGGRLDDSESRANRAEGRASALEGMITELHEQSEKAAADFQRLRSELKDEQAAKVKAETEVKETVKWLEEEKKLLQEAKSRLTDTFKALAADTLGDSNQAFIKLAKETFDKVLVEAKGDLGTRQEAIKGLVEPLSKSLNQFDQHVRALEKNRQEAYSTLETHLKTLSSTQQQLQKETGNLVTALRSPQVRGRWGEMTLKRVVELSGMSDHCDFTEQMSADSEQGRVRPDLIVHLPADRDVVVDAKVPLEAYLTALSAESEEDRRRCLGDHARQVRTHMDNLASKAYWEQFDKAPEFVVMFIPGESFFAAAVDVDHALIERGFERRVMLATPTTLIALLRAVGYGWRQEKIAESAQQISDLGKQLYDRMRVLGEHLVDIGKGLEKANTAYNSAVGSMEARVLPAARRFKELGAAPGAEIPIVEPISTAPRALSALELEAEANDPEGMQKAD